VWPNVVDLEAISASTRESHRKATILISHGGNVRRLSTRKTPACNDFSAEVEDRVAEIQKSVDGIFTNSSDS
jgi:hypothetical protein